MKKRKILIVDDDNVTRVKLCKRLEKAGFEVYSLDSAVNCLKLIYEKEIECVLMDNLMPELNGIDAIMIIRENISKTELPIIMVTSKAESSDVVEALGAGANDFIAKPVDISIAIARINNLLKISDLNNDSLRKKQLETLSATVATYNHEINNPLVIVYGNLKDADKISQENIDRARKALDRISSMVRKISDLIESEEVTTTNYVGETTMFDIHGTDSNDD